MKKKFVALLMALILCLMAGVAMAAAPVAKVGTTEYTSLRNAIKAAMATTDKTVVIIGEVSGIQFHTSYAVPKGLNIEGLVIEGSETGKITGKISGTAAADKQVSLKGVTFRNLKFEGEGRFAFAANHSSSYEGMVIEGCTFNSNSTSAAININKAKQSVNGLVIDGNTFNGYKYGVLLNGTGKQVEGGDEVRITNNTFTGCTDDVLQIVNIDNLYVANNKMFGNTGDAIINTKSCDEVTVSGNDITMNADDQFVLHNVTGIVDYSDNQLKDKNGVAVKLTDKNVSSGYGEGENKGKIWKTDIDHFVAIDVARNSSGKVTNGTFVGEYDSFKKYKADGKESVYIDEFTSILIDENDFVQMTYPQSADIYLDNYVYTGAQANLGFRSTAKFDKTKALVYIYTVKEEVVDGETWYMLSKPIDTFHANNCDSSLISFKNGSIEVSLTAAYLDSLAAKHGKGLYAIEIVENKNKPEEFWRNAFGFFEVKPEAKVAPVTPSVPKTGDESNIALWIALMGLAVAGMIVVGKKTRFN